MLDNIEVDYSKEVVELDNLVLPYRFKPYPHQEELIDTFFDMLEGVNSYKRFGLEWHRRAGKDMTFWQLIVAAATLNVGDYCYMLPTNIQSTKVIWNGNVNDSNGDACKFFDFIPPELGMVKHKSERRVELSNGSNIYVMGSDNYNSNVGMNAKGVVYSEWSLCDPESHAFFEPMLLKHEEEDSTTGWALFCWTPRGKNHAYETRQTAQLDKNKDFWYFSSLTVDVTYKSNGSPLISKESIQRALDGGADPDTVKQEYYLDYSAAVKGVVYAPEMVKAREEGRVTNLFNPNDMVFDKSLPVLVFWDIGMNDKNTMWCIQKPRSPKDKRIFVIDYYESDKTEGGGMMHYVDYLKGLQVELGFKYFGGQFLPHDGKVTEWGTGETRQQQLAKHFSKVTTIPRINRVENGVYQTKSIFNQFIFDEKRCSKGLKALDNYKYKVVNGVAKGFEHDEHSHGADGLRQIGQQYGVLPDEARDKLAQELSEQWNTGIANNYDSYNPIDL